MLESLLRISNFCWSGEAFVRATDLDAVTGLATTDGPLRGRFAWTSGRSDGGVMLARDRLGLNKLFLAIHDSGRVLAANYLIDLVERGVPFESIYSVPAGHVLDLDPEQERVALSPYIDVGRGAGLAHAGPEEVARDLRAELEVWFSRLAAQFGRAKISICLSGGLDSGIIAALAKQYFSDLTAYTCTFSENGASTSEDAMYAERLAEFLRIPLRPVPASSDEVVAALDDALCYGQDWRDFNVHCAIVNEILARAMRRDCETYGPDAPVLVLTGDLANEFLADYAPVPYEGQEYYRLPGIGPADLRLTLIRGLDAGDREVGIFNHHGLDVFQPYGLVVDQFLRLPGSFIAGERSKQALARAVAGDLLPGFIFDRVKVRAQIGSSTQPTGILPLLIQRGNHAGWLRAAFCRLFNIDDESFLNRFIRAGRYRVATPFKGPRSWKHGYIAA
jgi:asparagine synthetase B (glutamine-hydrolysing)